MHVLIFALLTALTVSCQNPSKIVYEPAAPDLKLATDERVTFEAIKTKILIPSCVKCHKKLDTQDALHQMITPGVPETSPFFITVENGSMPKNAPALSTADLELIREYIVNLKAKPVTFAQLKEKVLEPKNCLACHSKITEATISKWIDTETPEASALYVSVENGSMPKGGHPLSKDELDLVLRYVQGF